MTANSCKNNLFAKYGHDCELGSTRDELPMFKTGGNLCAQIKNQLRRSTMAADDNKRALKFFKSQRKIDMERINHLSHKRMLHPFSDLRRWWETLMVFIFIAIFIVIPLDLASYNFPIKHHLNNVVLWKLLRLFLDVVCCLDVIINFCTGYIDFKTKRVVMEPKKIAIRYIFTFFFPDLVSSIPTHLDVFARNGDVGYVYAVFQNTAVFKIFRFVTFLRYCKHTREVHNFDYVKSRVILSMFCYVLYFHVLTCVGLMVIGMTTTDKKKIRGYKKDIFVWRVDDREFDFFGAYFRVLRAVSYLSTYSFNGAIMSKHVPKIGLLLIWIVSKLIYFFLITQLMELVISSRSSPRKYLEMVRELKEYMGHKQLPITLQDRLLSYYNFKFQKSYFRESEILSVITGQLKQDLVMHSCRKLVEHVGFFQNLPLQLIVRIVSALTIEIYMVNDVIIRAGTQGTCMYFIATGCVAIYTKMGYEVKHLEDGEYFGEYSLLKRRALRESSVVAVETCELYRLDYEDFNKVITSYPDLIEKITRHAEDRIELTEYVEERFCRKKSVS